MAKNLGRKYATMSEDERRRFALGEEEGNRELPAALDFEDPRGAAITEGEPRDGVSARLDDRQHRRAVRDASSDSGKADD